MQVCARAGVHRARSIPRHFQPTAQVRSPSLSRLDHRLLAPPSSCSSADWDESDSRRITEFAVCDAQVTLLKLLDGYLQNPQLEGTPPPAGLVPFLLVTLTALSTNLRDLERPRESRDAATFQAVVLVLLALCSIGQGSDQGRKEVIGAIDETARKSTSLFECF